MSQTTKLIARPKEILYASIMLAIAVGITFASALLDTELSTKSHEAIVPTISFLAYCIIYFYNGANWARIIFFALCILLSLIFIENPSNSASSTIDGVTLGMVITSLLYANALAFSKPGSTWFKEQKARNVASIQTHKTILQTDESILLESIATGGVIFLTNNRLVFEPSRSASANSVIEIPIKEIGSASRTWTKILGKLPIYPNSIKVSTKNGATYEFIVEKHKELISKIEILINSAN